MNAKLESEKVIVEAPMSFTGSARRIWRITNHENNIARFFLILLAITLVTVAWSFVFAWYLVFGIFLIPYRMVRRSSRKRKRDEMRHREVLQAQATNKIA